MSMMQSNAEDMFAPANMIDAVPKAGSKSDVEKDRVI